MKFIETILSRLSSLIGSVPASERSGKKIDFDHSVMLDKIHDRNRLMAWLIEQVPHGSTWSIEGLYDRKAIATLSRFPSHDEVKIAKASIWPRQPFFKVELNSESKKEILAHIKDWDFKCDFIHQHLNHGDTVYLTAFDNLHLNCTWIWKGIVEDKIADLEKNGLAVIAQVSEQIENDRLPRK